MTSTEFPPAESKVQSAQIDCLLIRYQCIVFSRSFKTFIFPKPTRSESEKKNCSLKSLFTYRIRDGVIYRLFISGSILKLSQSEDEYSLRVQISMRCKTGNLIMIELKSLYEPTVTSTEVCIQHRLSVENVQLKIRALLSFTLAKLFAYPLSPSITVLILQTVTHTFLMALMERFCLTIKTFFHLLIILQCNNKEKLILINLRRFFLVYSTVFFCTLKDYSPEASAFLTDIYDTF